MLLIDSHCHVDRLNYHILHKNLDDVLKKSNKNKIFKILTVSTSIKNFFKIQTMIEKYSEIFCSCGIHPTNCQKELKNLKMLEKLSNIKGVIALGETGLDYYHSIDYKKLQQRFFREHIRLSLKLKKPIIIHARNAMKDVLKILHEQDSKNCTGVLHSFNEDYVSAYKLLDLGFYISFSGIVTFKNAISLQETAKKIPLNRLLIETDSPYLSPIPYRGQENQPAYLLDIAKKIASLKKIDLEEIARITTKNFYKLFNI